MQKEHAEFLAEITYGHASEVEVHRKGHQFRTWAVNGEHDPRKAFVAAVVEVLDELKVKRGAD